jgi:hypothetical protein
MVEETLSILHLDEPDLPIERGIDRPIAGRLVWGDTIPVPAAYRRERNGTDGAGAA